MECILQFKANSKYHVGAGLNPLDTRQLALSVYSRCRLPNGFLDPAKAITCFSIATTREKLFKKKQVSLVRIVIFINIGELFTKFRNASWFYNTNDTVSLENVVWNFVKLDLDYFHFNPCLYLFQLENDTDTWLSLLNESVESLKCQRNENLYFFV